VLSFVRLSVLLIFGFVSIQSQTCPLRRSLAKKIKSLAAHRFVISVNAQNPVLALRFRSAAY